MQGAERIFVGLGANLGDAAATLREALVELSGLPQTTLVAASPLYRSAPVDADGPDFINAIAELRSALEPEELLAQLHTIERRFLRDRSYRNAPRTLDLDLLFYGQRVCARQALTLPHPRLHQRAFVLAPLAELAPDWRLADGRSAAETWAALPPQRIERIAS